MAAKNLRPFQKSYFYKNIDVEERPNSKFANVTETLIMLFESGKAMREICKISHFSTANIRISYLLTYN